MGRPGAARIRRGRRIYGNNRHARFMIGSVTAAGVTFRTAARRQQDKDDEQDKDIAQT